MITKDAAAAKKITDNWLENIKDLPDWVEIYKLNHWSPSQLNSMDCLWSYKYLYLSQEERRKLPINSKMFAGVCIGDLAQLVFGDFLWQHKTGEGLIKKEIPPQRKVFDKILDKFNLYEPADDTDKAQHNVNRLGLAKAFLTLKKGLREINLKSPVECERSVSLFLQDCVLPTIGRIDVEDKNSFIEIKTKWKKKNRPKKDGTSTYSLPKIDDGYLGMEDHLAQVAFYYFANQEKKKPYLFVMNEENYNIFTSDNCDGMKPENLKRLLNKLTLVAKRRERIMNNHAGKNTWHQDIAPDFDHFFWKNMGEHKDIAMKLWGLQ
tara:strand:+ start:1006 stop:1968 length:963 start_codon:yes stop_codon:yes gene_type:complete